LRVRKVLIVRFSSLGDILQCFPAAQYLKSQGFDEVHWLTREDFSGVVNLNPYVDKTIAFDRKSGFPGLIKLAIKLRHNSYDLIYDAHNNLRSNILIWILRPTLKNLIRRPKFRLRRYLLFRWHRNLFGGRFVGRTSYLKPLGASEHKFDWKFNSSKENYVALVPGAAWPLKIWPSHNWVELIRKFPQQNFLILGGKSDEICFEIEQKTRELKVKNMAGKTSLVESIECLAKAKAVVANDTGLLHAADLLNVPTIALIGPSAFGYPASPSSQVMETDLWCKPCSKDGRGRCKNQIYMKCMRDINPESVSQILGRML